MTKDYSVEIKVRNNRLLSKMREAGIDSALALHRTSGVSYGQIIQYLGLKIAPMPYGRTAWSASVERLAACLKCMPEDLFPQRHIHEALAKNAAKFTADAADVHQLSASLRSLALPSDEKMLLAESKNALDAILDTLTPRERNIIEQRFGLIDGKEKTLGDIDGEGSTRERVRQVEMKALRKLRRLADSDNRLKDALVYGYSHPA